MVQGPRELLAGLDIRRLLDAVALALAPYTPGRRAAPFFAISAAHRLLAAPADDPWNDADRRDLAAFLASMTAEEWRGLARQAAELEALKASRRRRERRRRRAAR